MKKISHLFTTTAALLFACSAMAQSPYEFKCKDYIATPDRSQDKFSYDDTNNTFTINDTGTNNIAFQMDKKADYAYYITNEQTWFAVKGTNLSTATANSDIWWFNGFNKAASAEANHAVTTADGEQIVVWNIKDNSMLNANMNYDNEQIYISSQGNQFCHCMGLTSTKGTSTISMIGYFAPYELAATYPVLMTKMGYTADGKSLVAELKGKINALIAEAEGMIADEAYSDYKSALEAAKNKAQGALAGMGNADYVEALQVLKELRQAVESVSVESTTGISSYTRTANGIDAMQGDVCVKIMFHADKVVRVYKSHSAEIAKKSLTVVQPTAAAAEFALEEKDGVVTLDNTHVIVRLDLATACVTVLRKDGTVLTEEAGSSFAPYMDGPNESHQIQQSFRLATDEYIFGMGQVQNGALNQRGKVMNMVQDNMKVYIPYFQSTKNYGLFWDNYSPTMFSDSEEQTRFMSTGNEIDYYVLVGEKSADVLPLMRQLTGRSPMPALWNLGLYQSKERYTSANETMGVVNEYRKRGVPLDCIVQDWQYWGDDAHWNAMEFLNPTFSNYAQMISSIHNNNAKLMISVWANFGPQTKQYADFSRKGRMIDVVSYPWGAGVKPYDCYDATTRDEYWNYLYTGLMNKDIDALWLDSSEPDYQQKSTSDYDYVTGTGQTWRELRNAFPLAHVGGVHDHFRADALAGKTGLADKRVSILTRSAFAGQQRYGANTWSGDVTSSWENLANQIPAALNFSACGIPYWNSDIGGFFTGAFGGVGDHNWRRLYMRWLQFGTFTPMMRFHGTNTPREIYQFGNENDGIGDYDHILKYIKLRYRMLPYLYSTAWQVASADATFMTALPIAFNSDKNCYDIKDQYMFGDAFLVAPIIQDHTNQRDVYLPADHKWVDFWTGETHEGGQTVTKKGNADIMPLYVKAGSIMPWGPDVQYSTEKAWDNLEVRVYPGADGKFVLYEDENDGYAYENGKYTEIPFTWDDQAQTLTIGKRTGEFDGMLTERTFKICKVTKYHGTGDLHATEYSAEVKYSGEEVTVVLNDETGKPAQLTDCTTEYIQNHSFEDDGRMLTKSAPQGWTVDSNTDWWGVNYGGGNGDPAATDGNFIFGVWNGTVTGASISQTISNLPKGNYTLTVDLHASGTMTESRLGNQRLFANEDEAFFRDQVVTCGTGDNYPMQTLTLRFIQEEDGELVTIGVATDSAPTQTWFKIDNFRLYKTIDEDFVPTAINTASTATKVVGTELYDLSGRRILQYQKGVNIVRERMSDGTMRVKKVLKYN